MQRISRIKNKSEHQIAVTIQKQSQSIVQYINKMISSLRYIVERTLSWMSKARRLAKNYDKTVASAEVIVNLIGICLDFHKAIHF
ncbi:MAG: hypothetical protein ACRCXZ_10130 [Patescibacteria group bacterium]